MAIPLLFIGQAPPRIPTDIPFGRTHLYRWFERVGISKETLLAHSQATALVSHFPGANNHGGHKAPSPAEIAAERPRILQLIRDTSPKVIVPVGIMAIREILGDPGLTLNQTIGNAYTFTLIAGYESIMVVPLPHPSGASPWVHLGNDRALLDKALGYYKKLLNP